MHFSPGIVSGQTTSQSLVYSSNASDVDLFADAGSPTDEITLNVTINGGVELSASTTSGFGLRTNTGWHANTVINITNNGTISGKGGSGGAGGTTGAGSPGGAGGTAFKADRACTFENGSGVLQGGGGGGGGGGAADCNYDPDSGSGECTTHATGGNGGSGQGPSAASSGGTGGNCGAAAGNGGAGNTWGSAGSAGGTGSRTNVNCVLHAGGGGGAGGNSVEGNANITWGGTGTRTGAIS